MIRKNLFPLLVMLVATQLGACNSEEKTTTVQDLVGSIGHYARFAPSDGVIPFPSDLMFSGTVDGTLNVPVADPNDYSDPKVALNALDGFSPVGTMTTTFSTAVDDASLLGGDTVRVFSVSLTGPAVTGINSELVSGVDYLAFRAPGDGTTVGIVPLRALAQNATYLVTLSNGIMTAGGKAFVSDFIYALAKTTSPLHTGGVSNFGGLSDTQAQALEPLRQLTNAAEATVQAYTITNDVADTVADLPSANIILSWSFTTQSVSDTLAAVAGGAAAQTLMAVNSGMTLTALGLNAAGADADIYVGTLDLPYYLTAPGVPDNQEILSKFWLAAGGGFTTRYNPMPVATSTQTVPVLMTVPNGMAMPAGGWPVVIFQHGITQDRTNALAVASSLAAAGRAVIAIDLPLHGITDATSPLYAGAGAERTFDVDYIDNGTGVPGPDGVIDDSGSHFINLASLLTSRDNLRQGIADLLTLRASLGGAVLLDGTMTPTGESLNGAAVNFVGHSLGAIVGGPFLALDGNVGTSVLGMPGGHVLKVLDGSPTFGPILEAGLASAGVMKGTADYEAFMNVAQTVVDSGDPINYAAGSVAGRGLLLFEVVGGNANELPDQVVPNYVAYPSMSTTTTSPTAGTDPLAKAMGLTGYTASATGANLAAWVRFNSGHHGSLLSPNNAAGDPDLLSASVAEEMQSEMANFIGSGGAALVISNTNIIAPVLP